MLKYSKNHNIKLEIISQEMKIFHSYVQNYICMSNHRTTSLTLYVLVQKISPITLDAKQLQLNHIWYIKNIKNPNPNI